MSYVLSATSLD